MKHHEVDRSRESAEWKSGVYASNDFKYDNVYSYRNMYGCGRRTIPRFWVIAARIAFVDFCCYKS